MVMTESVTESILVKLQALTMNGNEQFFMDSLTKSVFSLKL